MNIITEGKAILEHHEGTVSKELPVFYNPDMKFNRDLSIHVINSIDKENMTLAFPMAGTGIRPLRFILESNQGKIAKVYMNDLSKDAIKHIKKQFKRNSLSWRKLQRKNLIEFSRTEANVFLMANAPMDYIDLDPFGYPGPFLDTAAKRAKHKGILAVTATDTSALCGTYIKACMRKYLAVPLKGACMHETGLRILIRRVQLAGLTYDKALTPIYSISKDHYMRVFFKVEQQKEKATNIFKQHGMYKTAGPLWTGKLWDTDLTSTVAAQDPENKVLQTIAEEAQIEQLGYFHVHALCKKLKVNVPNNKPLFEAVQKKGYKISRTHIALVGVRTNMPEEEFMEVIKSISN